MPDLAERGMAVGLRALNQLACGPAIDRLRPARPRRSACSTGASKTTGRTAARAGRTFAATQRLSRPARQPRSARSDLFDLDARRGAADATRVRPRVRAREAAPGGRRRADDACADPARAARPGRRARADDGRRARGARRRGRRALRGDHRADRRGARPGRHGDRGRLPGARRRVDRAQPVGRRRPAGHVPARRSSARTYPPPRSRCSSRARCSTRSTCRPRRGAPPAATSSTASSRSSRAPRDAELFVVAAELEDAGPALFIVESRRRRAIASSPSPRWGSAPRRTGRLTSRTCSFPPPRLLGDGERASLRRVRRARRGSAWCALAVGTGAGGARLRDPVRQRPQRVRRADLQPPGASRSWSPTSRSSSTGMRLATYRAASRADQGLDVRARGGARAAAVRRARRWRSAPTASSCSAATATSRSTRSSAGTATCGRPGVMEGALLV